MAKNSINEVVQPGQKRCFVITPIGVDGSVERRHADWVLFAAIKPVLEDKGYEVFRADTIADPAMITDAIFQHVIEDEICVADLTFLNPNVLYELGVRHALGKPVIHIAADGTTLPFDNSQHRAIFFSRDVYQSFEALKVNLEAQLRAIETPGFKPSSPLTHARGRMAIDARADDGGKMLADALSRIERLERNQRTTSLPTRNALLPNPAPENASFLGATAILGSAFADLIYGPEKGAIFQKALDAIDRFSTAAALGVSDAASDVEIANLIRSLPELAIVEIVRVVQGKVEAGQLPTSVYKRWALPVP